MAALTSISEPRSAESTPRLAIGIACLAVLVRLAPAILTYGTSDVGTWELLGRLLLNRENFYATQLHNWPVLWIYFCAAAVQAHDATGLPFPTLIKLPPIAADAVIAALLARDGARAGLAYALNPVAILITGYHGQFDALMLAPAFLAYRLFDASEVPSALALGLGNWFKPIPLLLLPVVLPRLGTWWQRITYTALSLAPAVLGTLPYFLLWPQDVAANFLGYASWFGQWGYPVLWMVVEFFTTTAIPWWLPDPEHVSAPLHAMFVAGRFILVACLALTWLVTLRRRASLLQGILVTFAVFYFATSGFGVQYLLWIIPFAVAARDRWLWPFSITATLLLLVAYTLGAAYMQLSVTPDNGPSLREFAVKLATLPCWIVCGLWAWSLMRPGASVSRAAATPSYPPL